MTRIKLRLRKNGYEVIVGSGVLASLPARLKEVNIGTDAFVITNPLICGLWGKRLSNLLRRNGFGADFLEIPDTEKSKSMDTCLRLIEKITARDRLKKAFLITFGGGVVGDVGGFTAAIYKRGMPYIQLPTTLLAQVDAAIGGKTAVDLKKGKNLVGAFFQPRLVLSETDFLSTLPRRQVKNGLAEVIKYGVIKDPALFGFLEKNMARLLRLDKTALAHIVERASRIKASIVEKDELDKSGVRAILNYGHTIGHAVEAATGYSSRYSHGEAVSIGMAAANQIAEEMGLLADDEKNRIEQLLARAGLPVRARGVSPAKVYSAHLYDKKFIHGKNRFVLPVRVGKVRVVEGVPEGLVRKVINSKCGSR